MIAAWVLLALALAPLQPKLQTIASDESETFFTRGADSTRVDHLLDTRFPEGHDATAVIAFQAAHGSINDRTAELGALTDAICASDTLPVLKGVGSPGGTVCGELGHVLAPQSGPSAFSKDDPSSAVLFSVVNGRDDTESVAKDVEATRALLPGPDGNPLRSYVTGQAGFDADRSAAVEGLDGRLLAITGALVLLLMLWTYRSIAIAAMMLGVVAVAYVIATGIIYGLVQADVTTVSGQSTAILIVLMFGAGTDYCLLIVSRYREGDAMRRAGPAILAAGGIVVASMLILTLADYNATREMGPILAIGILVMMAAALTLLPALLTFTKPRPRKTTQTWTRIGALVKRRPAQLAGVCIALLTLGALGNLKHTGYLDLAHQYRDVPESVQGQQLIAERYDPIGRVAPVDVVVDSNVALDVKDALARVPFVASSETDSGGDDLVSIEVLLKVDPFSLDAMDRIERLRDVVKTAAGGHLALIGGVTATNHDNRQALNADARLIVPLVLGLILLVLIVLLRCLVAPLYLIATVILSFAFSMGIASLVFENSDPSLALFAFIFLVALGVDDNIFLMTRIREEGGDVIKGLERTGGVITSAGLILAGTFAALMALDLEALFQVGFTVSLGLLIDAFVVRTFLVPSIAVLLGERNWWPAFVPRRAKDVVLRTADR